METFYDIGTGDLRELWDSDLDPAMQEVFKCSTDSDMQDWFLERDVKPQVILHDRLMTDAALGTAPIKSEHSYSLNSLNSDGDCSMPESPIIIRSKMDDMEDECYPAIPMDSATARRRGADSPALSSYSVKEEPYSEPASPDPDSSCPASPENTSDYSDMLYTHNSSSIQLNLAQQSLLKHSPTLMLSSNSRSAALFGIPATPTAHSRNSMPKLNIKAENNSSSAFGLPPTPPSSLSSDDSEGNLSPEHHPASPNRRESMGSSRLFTSGSSSLTVSTRQPIHTPLISSQPKGSTGMLMLTEEEKRTLLAEGYPIPTRLPLTKAEEKSLKKIRRKIKNKISAQESRRKKKEYMDQLERKVEILVTENVDYRKRVENLEDSNANLLSQLAKLQAIVNRQHRK